MHLIHLSEHVFTMLAIISC